MADRDRYHATIERYLRQRGAHGMPPELPEEVVRAAEYTPQEPRAAAWPMLPRLAVGSAVLAVAILVAMIAAELWSMPTGADLPSATPRATTPVLRSPAPTAEARGDLGLSAGEHATVVGDRIEARYQRVTESPVSTVLTAGDRVYVVEGPIAVDDAVWYRVQHPAHRSVPGFVWVSFETQAQADEALVAFEPRCPSSPIDMELFEDLTAMERLLCFGDAPITIGPVFVIATGSGDEEPSGEPDWLAGVAPWELYTTFNWPNATTQGSLSGRIEPGTSAQLTSESWMEVVGRFDHSAATGCLRQVPEAGYVESPELEELWCRQQFVILDASAALPPPED